MNKSQILKEIERVKALPEIDWEKEKNTSAFGLVKKENYWKEAKITFLKRELTKLEKH